MEEIQSDRERNILCIRYRNNKKGDGDNPLKNMESGQVIPGTARGPAKVRAAFKYRCFAHDPLYDTLIPDAGCEKTADAGAVPLRYG